MKFMLSLPYWWSSHAHTNTASVAMRNNTALTILNAIRCYAFWVSHGCWLWWGPPARVWGQLHPRRLPPVRRSGSSKPRVTVKDSGHGIGFRNVGIPASSTKHPAMACGTTNKRPNFRRRTHSRPTRRAPLASASSVIWVSMFYLHDDCYHHRCSRFLSLGGG